MFKMNKEQVKKEISEENILKFFSESFALESEALHDETMGARWHTARRCDMLVDYFFNLSQDPELKELLIGMMSDLSILLYEAEKKLN